MKMLKTRLFILYIIASGTIGLYEGTTAATFYVDPIHGNINNTGDINHPWDTLEQVFRQRKALAAGDSLLLLSGYHGAPGIRGNNSDYIVISADKDQQPTCKSISFSGASKWKVQNITISPEAAPAYEKTTLVQINNSASEIFVENCFAYSVLDNSSWSQNDWSANSCSGVSIDGSHNTIKDCHFLNVKHGILVESSAQHNLIDHNVVENFAADGMRGIGSYNTFQYNTVKNCYDVDDNHDDGFQSYSYSNGNVGTTTVYGIILRGNTIINYSDPNQKFRGTLQGIGCFDGMYEDWLIENNVIIVDHWHGISLYGAKNCKIVNNTVIDNNTSSPGPPWIKITAHKDGTKSTDNVIRNNLTTSMSNDADIGDVDHNFTISFSSYDSYFVDAKNFDLSLKESARAIDRGSELDAPAIDIIGTSRPQGNGFDLGAYEYIAPTSVLENPKFIKLFDLRNYPNPFNPKTIIAYNIQRPGHVELAIYNILGTHISTLVNQNQNAGEHVVQFDAKNLSSGFYLCKINVDGNEDVRRMVLQK